MKIRKTICWKNEYENMKKLYQSGLTSGDIAKIYNTSASTITQILSKLIKLRTMHEVLKLRWETGKGRPEKLKNDKEDIKKLYLSGESTVDLAKKYNVSSSFISRIIIDITRSHEEARNLAIKKHNWGNAKWRSEYREFQDLYTYGYSTIDIGKLYSTHHGTISKILKRTIGLRTAKKAGELNAKQEKFRGENCYRWIKDRSKLSRGQRRSEEDWFTRKVLKERDYTCELTNIRGGFLEVHHKAIVHKNKELQFEKSNVIVIQKKIHRLFHRIYGSKKCTVQDWDYFVSHKEYLKSLEQLKQEKLIPFKLKYKINLINSVEPNNNLYQKVA